MPAIWGRPTRRDNLCNCSCPLVRSAVAAQDRSTAHQQAAALVWHASVGCPYRSSRYSRKETWGSVGTMHPCSRNSPPQLGPAC